MRRIAWAGGLFLGLWLVAVPSARAVITALTPLSAQLKESTFIVVTKVDAVDVDKRTMILVVEEQLKDKLPFARLPVNLKSSAKNAEKEYPVLSKRLAPKLPLVLFVKDQGDGDYYALAFTNGTWFMISGVTPQGAKEPRWVLVNLEPYLRRTYKGTTAEMRQTVIDGLAGKKVPPPNDKEEPGVGPEVKKEEKEEEAAFRPCSPICNLQFAICNLKCLGVWRSSGGDADAALQIANCKLQIANCDPAETVHLVGGPPFAVIPSVLVGGPLAILAMLFPTWFGGWRRWFALISGLCTASTVIFVYWMWGHLFAASAWGGDLAQWLMVTVVIVLSAAWAWQRHLTRVQDGDAPAGPSTAELVILAVLAVLSAVALLICWKLGVNLKNPSWLILAPIGISAVVGLAFVAWARRTPKQETPWEELDLWTPAAPSSNGAAHGAFIGSSGGTAVALAVEAKPALATSAPSAPPTRPALATEVVMLTAMAVACTALAGVQEPRRVQAGRAEMGDSQATLDDLPIAPGKQAWVYRSPDGGNLASSPLVAGGRVYIGATIGTAFPKGVVYCIDRSTGKLLWNTEKTIKKMKSVSISSPVLADGKLFIGEGFHQDVDCKVYAIDAETGKPVWTFQTGSHTESSPYVIGGKVYIGAGDDGMYCLDASDGKEVWHYNGLHIDANPVVKDGRVYVGAGEGDLHKETAIICLDAGSGKELWKQGIDVPAWGSPVVAGGLVYFGIGNGRVNEKAVDPKGAVLCVNATDGTTVWRHDTKDGVLSRPTVDRSRCYFGSRDGSVYCVDRRNGRLVWKNELQSPIVTAVALARSAHTGVTTGVYVLSSEGQVYCLGPNAGREYWSADLTDNGKVQATLWSSPDVRVYRDSTGETRQIVFGAMLGPEGSPSPMVFCYEDRLQFDPAADPVESRP
jgi:outer membrane protein assembly factor BamB